MKLNLRESNDVERPVVRWARGHGCIVFKLTLGGNRGWPDTLILRNGRHVFVEFKRSGGSPRPLQLERISELRNQGFSVQWFDDSAQAIEFLTNYFSLCAG